jgi:uncharacterized protein YpmS
MKKGKNAQSWSVDIMLAAVLFIGAFFIFFIFLSGPSESSAKQLQDEAALVIRQFSTDNDELNIVDNNELNTAKATWLKLNLTYADLKQRLRIGGDFCIFVEDQEGNIVLINNTYKGIGSPDIEIDGIPCSVS